MELGVVDAIDDRLGRHMMCGVMCHYDVARTKQLINDHDRDEQHDPVEQNEGLSMSPMVCKESEEVK